MTATIGLTAIGLTEVEILTAKGGPLLIEADGRLATLIDGMLTIPAWQEATLAFIIANTPTACIQVPDQGLSCDAVSC